MKSKKIKNEENNILVLDKDIINNEIEKKNKYKRENIQILKWESDLLKDTYIAQIKQKNFSFIGILNGKYEREGFGINKFEMAIYILVTLKMIKEIDMEFIFIHLK